MTQKIQPVQADYSLDIVGIETIYTKENRQRKDLGDLSSLVLSINKVGLINPIAVEPSGEEGKFYLIAGERRLESLKVLKQKKAPVRIFPPGTDQETIEEIELAENLERLSLSWWEEMLAKRRIIELKKKRTGKETYEELEPVTGLSKSTLQDIYKMCAAIEQVPALKTCKNAHEARKKLKGMVTGTLVDSLKRKQAEKRIQEAIASGEEPSRYNNAEMFFRTGDTFQGMAKLQDGISHIIEVDPPYGIDLKNMKKRQNVDVAMEAYIEIPEKEYPSFLEKLCNECFRLASPDSWIIFWFGHQWYSEVIKCLTNSGFAVDPIPGIWLKENFQGQTAVPDMYLSRVYEPFVIGRKGRPAITKEGRKNVFSYKPMPSGDKRHPTQKPRWLYKEIFETFGTPGAVILIPFLGSGEGIIAAMEADMRAFGWDMSERVRTLFLEDIEELKAKEKGEEVEEDE